MTMLYHMKLLKLYIFVFIGVAGLNKTLDNEAFEKFESIFDFCDGLKNESENDDEYANKIQALFCPGQPICTSEDDINSTYVLKTLPEIIGVGMEVIRLEDLYKVVGACCLPCSCDTKTCKENGNCCLSKNFVSAIEIDPDIDNQNVTNMLDGQDDFSGLQEDENTTAVHSECIKASWLSYQDKDHFEIDYDLDIPGYFMITQCFENNTRQADVTKCKTPSESQNELLRPVISSVTGRIYWNSYCARCNNDEKYTMPWTASIKFNADIRYFANISDPIITNVYPDTYTDILKFISTSGNIIYTPPIPQEDKLCLRKNTLLTCRYTQDKAVASWLMAACERIYSPLIIENSFGYQMPFRNVFCYLCRQQYIKPRAGARCVFTQDHGKIVSKGMAALLDYSAPDSSHSATSSLLDKCRCDEIYDHYLHFCRRVYCPAGDYMVNCQCVQPFKLMYGMPILLTIKLIPKTGQLQTLTTNQVTKAHNTLKKLLHTISENISIECIGLLECITDTGSYFLSLVVVRSLPGHDTKEIIHPFLNYLDKEKPKTDMVIKRSTYSVRITSRIRLWTLPSDTGIGTTNLRLNIEDLDSTIKSHITLFDNTDLHKAFDQKFQILTPLLYCMQVRLNDTEFKELDGRLATLLTPKKIILPYYRRISNTTVQVCADQYMEKRENNSGIVVLCLSKFYMHLYILLIHVITGVILKNRHS